MRMPRLLYPALFAFAVLALGLAGLNMIGFVVNVGASSGMEQLGAAAVLTGAGLLLLAVIDIRRRLEDRA